MLRTICYMVVGRVCALLFALHVENCLTVLPDDEGKRKRNGVGGVLLVVQRVGGGGSMSWAKTNYVRAQGRSSGQVRVLLAVATRLRRSTRHPSTSFTHSSPTATARNYIVKHRGFWPLDARTNEKFWFAFCHLAIWTFRPLHVFINN